jgi:hypothetical protein
MLIVLRTARTHTLLQQNGDTAILDTFPKNFLCIVLSIYRDYPSSMRRPCVIYLCFVIEKL